MKDFAKSIVCNTKAEAEKIGNFEDPKDAKRYIQMWERRKQDAKSWIDDANRKLRELHKDHGGAFGPLSESEKRSHKAEAQRHEDTIRKYQAEFEKYDNLIKQAQKSTWGNRKCGNADVVKDGNTWVVLYAEGTKSKEFDSEAEAKKFAAQVGNSKVGNGLSDSYEFLMSAGKNDYNSIKEEVKKAGGWTPEIKAKARKTSDTLKKKAKELVETAHKQSAELEKLAGDIESI